MSNRNDRKRGRGKERGWRTEISSPSWAEGGGGGGEMQRRDRAEGGHREVPVASSFWHYLMPNRERVTSSQRSPCQLHVHTRWAWAHTSISPLLSYSSVIFPTSHRPSICSLRLALCPARPRSESILYTIRWIAETESYLRGRQVIILFPLFPCHVTPLCLSVPQAVGHSGGDRPCIMHAAASIN